MIWRTSLLATREGETCIGEGQHLAGLPSPTHDRKGRENETWWALLLKVPGVGQAALQKHERKDANPTGSLCQERTRAVLYAALLVWCFYLFFQPGNEDLPSCREQAMVLWNAQHPPAGPGCLCPWLCQTPQPSAKLLFNVTWVSWLQLRSQKHHFLKALRVYIYIRIWKAWS